MFSDHVVESGTALFENFGEVKKCISAFYQRFFEANDDCDDALWEELQTLKGQLIKFDELWTTYEQKYVYELMVIENDARRFIIDSINAEAVLCQKHMESTAKLTEFNEKRKTLLENICQVNAVANQEGKGRSDFELSLLLRAEKLMEPTEV